MISSTATTVSYSRTTKTDGEATRTAAVVIWVASGVVFVRILIEIAAVAPEFLPVAAGPIGIMLLLFAITSVLIWRSATAPSESPLKPGNPSELKPAILFGALYAGVLFAVAGSGKIFWAAPACSQPPPYRGSRISTRSLCRLLSWSRQVAWRRTWDGA